LSIAPVCKSLGRSEPGSSAHRDSSPRRGSPFAGWGRLSHANGNGTPSLSSRDRLGRCSPLTHHGVSQPAWREG
jgi:hypothetical protein